MVEGRWYPQGADIGAPLAVRQAVFGTGLDALDGEAQQVAVFGEGGAVGSARLWWAQGDFWAGDIGVLPGERGKGYGDLLVRLLLYKAASHGAACLRILSPAALASFFARYGFTAEGEGDPLAMRAVPATGCSGCGSCSGAQGCGAGE